ncbi:MAG: hypothetical protein HKN96_02360 [Flavobacteriaceae bacterium]|nr:hypothetical protein [Bacteroidia bacterium]NND10028.1 hypothetical protein [Flavobacteriaceae bacterium]NNK27273.1 hypothetical protein [Flavobacteriaceae bacterium]NNL62094.1 hypothetical protein [Flavobacteriaceae bacterium]
MDKFFNSTFDALTNVVPGSVIIAIIILFDPSLATIDDVIAKLNEIKFGSATILVFISYVLGFIISPIGKLLYQKIGFKIWPMTADKGPYISISDKFILVREYSPSNFKYIESWNMFCNLSHNLAVGMLVLFVASVLRLILVDGASIKVFGVIALIAIIAFFILLKRAVVFRIWAMNDLNAAIDRLELVQKAEQGKS